MYRERVVRHLELVSLVLKMQAVTANQLSEFLKAAP
jgi:hypothetical protein